MIYLSTGLRLRRFLTVFGGLKVGSKAIMAAGLGNRIADFKHSIRDEMCFISARIVVNRISASRNSLADFVK